MKPIVKKGSYELDLDIVGRVMLQAVMGMLADSEKNDKSMNHLRLASCNMLIDIKRFLDSASYYSLEGFFREIAAEHADFRIASQNLTAKVRETLFLYLDGDGNPYPKEIYWHNNSSDAD